MLEKFQTYQLSVQLYQQCQQVRVPAYVRDQLLRASLSVALNLAEGSAKPSEKERRRYYSIAYASAREVQAILQIHHRKIEYKLADRVGACLYRLVYVRTT